MLLTTVVLAASVMQTRKEMDGHDRRRVFEGTEAAKMWAKWKTQELYPVRVIANEDDPDRRGYLMRESRACEYVLRIHALNHVAEVYKVRHKLMNDVMSDRFLAESVPYTPEKETMAIHDPNAPAWERKGTLFDPDKVVIPRQYAKRFNYKNPDPRKKQEFNRRSASQDLKERLLNSSSP